MAWFEEHIRGRNWSPRTIGWEFLGGQRVRHGVREGADEKATVQAFLRSDEPWQPLGSMPLVV